MGLAGRTAFAAAAARLLLALAVLAAGARGARGQDLTAVARLNQRADAAIDRAITWLWARHQGDHWSEQAPGFLPRDHGGVTALCAYALLSAGQSHQSPQMAATLDWLARQDLHSLWAHSFRALALSMLPGAHRPALQADLDYLLSAIRQDGSYAEALESPQGEWNNSSSELALLAVASAGAAGLEVPPWFWQRSRQHWLTTQTADGGWSYASARKAAYGSMTAAGLASLYLCQDVLGRRESLELSAHGGFPQAERGLAWLGEHFSAYENPGRGPQYYHEWLWCLERAGRASGHKYFGRHNWFAEGAAQLLRRQGRDGGWKDEVSSSFALLFLARGRHCVLFSKLRHAGPWDVRPHDLAHLTDWFGRTFETPVSWQVLDIDAAEQDGYDAPILYISGLSPPDLSEAQMAKLRRFCLRGGLIWSESAGNNAAFDRQMRQWYARLLPQWPLKDLPPTHPIYSAHAPIQRPLPLLGISNGLRLLAVHAPIDLSGAYQQYNPVQDEDAFRLAANLYFLVGDAGALRRRGQSFLEPVATPPPATLARLAPRTVRVVQLELPVGMDAEPLALERLTEAMRRQCRVELEIVRLKPGDLEAEAAPAALLAGTQAFTLSGPERVALRAFINAGGLIIADAVGGSEAFDAAARQELLTLLDDSYPRAGRLGLSSQALQRPGFRIRSVAYRRAARAVYGQDDAPQLQVVCLGDRPAIVYSRDDLTAGLVGYRGHDFRGYAPSSALALVRNLILYAADRPRPDKPLLKGSVDVQWGGPTRPAEPQ